MPNSITDYITLDEPFGPIDAKDFDDENDITNEKIFKQLFEPHNRMHKLLFKRPSIILGRRGSGKTTYLQYIPYDKQDIIPIKIITHDAFAKVIKGVEDMSRNAIFPESVAELWEKILLTSAFAHLRQHMVGSPEFDKVEGYLTKIGIRDRNSVDAVIWTVTDALKKQDTTIGVIADALSHFDKLEFRDAHSAVIAFLKKLDKRLVLLMDSTDSVEEISPQFNSGTRAWQGLLKLAGSMNKPSSDIDIVLCLQTELYHHYYLEISSNSNKDFRRTLWLQWVSSELLMLGAQRLLLFLSHYHPDFYQKAKYVNIESHNNVSELFNMVLPGSITNINGMTENSISYVLRHTQLLPRHFLILMNSIFSMAEKSGSGHFPPLSHDVVNGIRKVEERLAHEILKAYSPIYPKAKDVCQRCIPELSHRFTHGELQAVFSKFGKKVSATDDFFDFKRMLMETGIIGRVISETDMYIKGLFEYTTPNKLITSTEDDLCLHPLFSGAFSSKAGKPVYPYGVQEDEDAREPF